MASLGDKFARHAHFVERYKTGQFKRFLPFLERVQRDLRNRLLVTNTIRSRSVLENKIKDIEQMILFHYTQFTDEFRDQLEMFATSEANFGLKAIGNDLDAPTPALSRLKAAYNSRPFNNRLLKEALKDFSKEQARMIRDSISMGFFEGQTTPEIIKNIIGTSEAGFKDGLMHVSRVRASRMVRTAINHVAAVAKDQLFKENSDIISHYEWISTLDNRTSEICQGLDGTIYPVGKGRLPPAHPNCRSTIAPILKADR